MALPLCEPRDPVELPEFPRFLPTRDVPWIDEDQREMLVLLHSEPLISLALHLEKKAKAKVTAARLRQGGDASTAQKMLDDEGGVRVLLHSVPAKMLRALVMGTLGWQAGLPDGDPLSLRRKLWRDDGPGAYVATMGVEGRFGKGPSGREYLALSRTIDRYLEAYRILEDTRPADRTLEMREKVTDAHRVDRFYASSVTPFGGAKLTFVSSEAQAAKVARLSATFRGFYDRAADKDAHLLQTISSVRCSAEAVDDRSAHRLLTERYRGSDYAWWLAMSCLRAAGLSPDVTVRHGLRAWEPGQVPVSEMLLAAVGRTEVESWGFDCEAPGTAAGEPPSKPRNWDDDILEVMEERTYLPDALRSSSQTAQKATLGLQRIDKAQKEIPQAQLDILTLMSEEGADEKHAFDDEGYIHEQMNLGRAAINSMKQYNEDIESCIKLFDWLGVSKDDEEGEEEADEGPAGEAEAAPAADEGPSGHVDEAPTGHVDEGDQEDSDEEYEDDDEDGEDEWNTDDEWDTDDEEEFMENLRQIEERLGLSSPDRR
ncbi:hypothetical protein F4781DRAFT_430254 [Annulohypoxylon bovei var. microspora]|nr:hypothetical protein F4781DRAFT_430254 [Annulohypoxylon bovei var. microspora]